MDAGRKVAAFMSKQRKRIANVLFMHSVKQIINQHPIPISVRRHVEAGQKFLARGNLRYERKSIV